mgnify:CR=1 FL=1
MVIHKYIIDNINMLELPEGSKILSVHNQKDRVVLYAAVNTDSLQTEHYQIDRVCTGESISYEEEWIFIGTVMIYDGSFVVHIFYRKEE